MPLDVPQYHVIHVLLAFVLFIQNEPVLDVDIDYTSTV